MAGLTRSRRVVQAILVPLVASVILLGPDLAASLAESTPATAPAGPNIVLIMTDDQRWDMLTRMPNVQSLLVAHGVSFLNDLVANPLCCPTRTTTLTGETSGHTGVWSNDGSHGGFASFKDGSTIATWLQAAGYRTGLFGKYLNGYTTPSYVAPGWSRWVAWNNTGDGYYNYTLSVDGASVSHGSLPSDYSTDVYRQYVVDFIQSTPGTQPLFAWFAPRAPHKPMTPGPQYTAGCQGLAPLRPPSFNEANVSDKPAYIRAIGPLSASRIATLDKRHLNACRTLLSVDDAVGSIVQALADTGRLSDTMIVFASDNGYLFGEHRWEGKKVPYDESIRVPLVVRYDPVTTAPTTSSALVSDLDLASTFAALAGVTPGLPQDGMSFLPLLSDPSGPWRQAQLIEGLDIKYCGVRTPGYMYAQYATGEEELYDLSTDPFELLNVVADPSYASILGQLRTSTHALCNPVPPGFVWHH